jgi:ribonuclease J
MSDSTNAQQEKTHIEETKVGEEIEKLIKNTKKRVIISTFASNIFRVLQII